MMSLTYIVPPECCGQIVEYSYASDEDAVYMRIVDRSDGSVREYWADWPDADCVCEPWNCAPDIPEDSWVEVAS